VQAQSAADTMTGIDFCRLFVLVAGHRRFPPDRVSILRIARTKKTTTITSTAKGSTTR
jgi:hypothetical protein